MQKLLKFLPWLLSVALVILWVLSSNEFKANLEKKMRRLRR
jgi:hypothetical protein